MTALDTGALWQLLGNRVQEFAPLPSDHHLGLDNGTIATVWSEPVEIIDPDVEVIARYPSGHLAGGPALTLRSVGRGSAAYVSARLGIEGLRPLVRRFAVLGGKPSPRPVEDDAPGQGGVVLRSRGVVGLRCPVARTPQPTTGTGRSA